MPLDGKILYRAKMRLEEKKAAREEQLTRRTLEVYRRNPKIRSLDLRIKQLVVDAMGAAFTKGANPEKLIREMELENLALQQERAQLLREMGLPEGFLDDGYMCPDCRDTGYAGTTVCHCLMDLYREEQNKELSALLNIGQQSFDTFELDYYDAVPDPNTKTSPRDNMALVSEACYRYAERFGKNSMNLFLSGGPGLGKTFLSACIAKVVAEKGFSVVYDTAYNIFEKFEQEKFAKADDMDAIRAETNRYMVCDLLIIDDLGMEMTTAFVASALYNLINSRIVSGKKTVINSNLSVEDLQKRYSPQVVSRIMGEYTVLPFYGRDIRLIKKERG